MIANDCEHFEYDLDDEWCGKYKVFKCDNCPDYVKVKESK